MRGSTKKRVEGGVGIDEGLDLYIFYNKWDRDELC